jgi:hypothetical protein
MDHLAESSCAALANFGEKHYIIGMKDVVGMDGTFLLALVRGYSKSKS